MNTIFPFIIEFKPIIQTQCNTLTLNCSVVDLENKIVELIDLNIIYIDIFYSDETLKMYKIDLYTFIYNKFINRFNIKLNLMKDNYYKNNLELIKKN
jgi:hypothetical protein